MSNKGSSSRKNKLKKLSKRIRRVQPENERSGLLTRAEYEEYQLLVLSNDNNILSNNNISNKRLCHGVYDDVNRDHGKSGRCSHGQRGGGGGGVTIGNNETNSNHTTNTIVATTDNNNNSNNNNKVKHRHLDNRSHLGPSIRYRKRQRDDDDVVNTGTISAPIMLEGAQHRDLLVWLLRQAVIGRNYRTLITTSTEKSTGSTSPTPSSALGQRSRQEGHQEDDQPTYPVGTDQRQDSTTKMNKKRKHSSTSAVDDDDDDDSHNVTACSGGDKINIDSTTSSSSNNRAVPSWASIHNPGMVQQVAVLEVQIELSSGETIETYSSSLSSLNAEEGQPSLLVTKTTAATNDKKQPQQQQTHCQANNSSNLHSSLGCSTKWFQGDAPKSMSESLLYFSKNYNKKSQHNRLKKVEDYTIASTGYKSDGTSSMETTYHLMTEILLLSDEEMIRQGYPQMIASQHSKPTDNGSVNHVDEPSSREESMKSLTSLVAVPLDRAKEFVTRNGVQIQLPRDHDNTSIAGDNGNLYVCTSASSYKEVSDTRDDGTTATAATHGMEHGRIFGLDCEMVNTTEGSELARVTIIQFDDWSMPDNNRCNSGEIKTTTLLDCLVRPENTVVDYLTKHSGITPELLEPVSTRLAQIQYAMAQFLTPEDILVGHSLENDLRALRYIHPRVVDTAIVFRPNHRRHKFSLRHLARILLKKNIQSGSHCSEEDAHVALELAIRKAWYGDDLHVPGGKNDDRTFLLQYLESIGRGKSLKENNGGTRPGAVFIGNSDWIQTHVTNNPTAAHAISYDSPEDCKKAMLAWLKGHRKSDLVWSNIRLRSIKNMNKSSCNGHKDQTVNALQSFITDLVCKLPPTCVLMVALQSNLDSAFDMRSQRRACMDARSSLGWSDDREETWKSLLETTRLGYVQWYHGAAT